MHPILFEHVVRRVAVQIHGKKNLHAHGMRDTSYESNNVYVLLRVTSHASFKHIGLLPSKAGILTIINSHPDIDISIAPRSQLTTSAPPPASSQWKFSRTLTPRCIPSRSLFGKAFQGKLTSATRWHDYRHDSDAVYKCPLQDVAGKFVQCQPKYTAAMRKSLFTCVERGDAVLSRGDFLTGRSGSGGDCCFDG